MTGEVERSEASYIFGRGLYDQLPMFEGAECVNADPEIFFRRRYNKWELKIVKSICGRCVAKERCLDFAMDTPGIFGVWGGTTYMERSRLRKVVSNAETG